MQSSSSSLVLARLVRLAILGLGVLLAAKLVPGIRYDDGGSLIAAVVLLTLFNWVLKPVLVLFTLPFIIATLGVGIIFINALVFLIVGHLVQGFHVATFGAAILGSLVVSVTNFLISALMRRTERRRPPPPGPRGPGGPPGAGNGDDVIDI